MHPTKTQFLSTTAPGLLFAPPILTSRNSKRIEVISVNYDYLPMALESPKVMWVDLRSPAPPDMLVGTPVTLFTSNKLFSLNITDIIGSRVVLSPYRGGRWLPTNHSACDGYYAWGYNTEQSDVRTWMHGPKYGYGVSASYIEYSPIIYSSRRGQPWG